jgi:hypothetical protein
MGHVFYISDGTTTVYLMGSTSSNVVTGYTPTAPPRLYDVEEAENPENAIVETVECVLVNTTTDLIRTDIRSIQKLLNQASRYTQTRQGPQVFLKFQPGGSGTVHRSELLGGQIEYDEDALDLGWWGLKMSIGVILSRRPYWEEDALTTLSLGTVYPYHDSTHNNHADTTALQATGDMPTPVQVKLTLGQNGVDYAWLGHTAWQASAVHQFEGESASGIDTSVGSANFGDDEYGSVQNLTDTATDYFTWTLSNVDYYGGQYYRVIARFPGAPSSGTWVKVRLYDGTNLLYDAPEARELTTALFQELGTIKIAPNAGGLTSLANLKLTLNAYNENDSGAFDIDYLCLIPAEGLRYVQPTSLSLAAADVITDDGILGVVYVSNASGKHMGMAGYGKRPVLWPGRINRFYTIWGDDTANVVNWSGSLSVSFYPRRGSL